MGNLTPKLYGQVERMFEIYFTEKINAPADRVWQVITKIEDYPQWNSFVEECKTTFEVGSEIKMKVRMFPFFAVHQTETITQYVEGELIEYCLSRPSRSLSSSRKHIVTSISENCTEYVSQFMLDGSLSGMLQLLIGRQLRRGFAAMTRGIVERSESMTGSSWA